MIDKNKEFFSPPYYFFLKETNNKYYLYFSIANTLNEARQKDDVVSFVREKEQDVKKFLKSLLKSKKQPTQKEVKDELEELQALLAFRPNVTEGSYFTNSRKLIELGRT